MDYLLTYSGSCCEFRWNSRSVKVARTTQRMQSTSESWAARRQLSAKFTAMLPLQRTDVAW